MMKNINNMSRSEALYSDYKEVRKDKILFKNLIIAILLLVIALIFNFYIGQYANIKQGNSVEDIFLSNFGPYDVDGIFVYGTFIFLVYITFYCIAHPKQAPYIIKSISLFVIIRAVFVSLTHIGPYPTAARMDVNADIYTIFSKISFSGDLFFSGHTGMPFLMALVFWKSKWRRYTFLVGSVVFGVVVLLGHLHYSIDVLAAFFITYTIYDIIIYMFAEDKKYFEECFSKKLS